MKFKQGQSFHAIIPSHIGVAKIYIQHVIPSYYEGVKLVVYKVWLEHSKYWHEAMCLIMK